MRRSSYHIVDGSQPHSLLIIQARREGECGRPFGSLVVDVGMIQCCPRMFLELLVCWEGSFRRLSLTDGEPVGCEDAFRFCGVVT